MNLNVNEIQIHDSDDAVDLWRVRGIPRTWFPTKIAAEVAARQCFPEEDPTLRYQRIAFKQFGRIN